MEIKGRVRQECSPGSGSGVRRVGCVAKVLGCTDSLKFLGARRTGPWFPFVPSPTARLWSASEMIKTKRILNVWNSPLMPFAYFFSLSSLPSYNFSSWESCLFASLLSSGPVRSEMIPSTHQLTLLSFWKGVEMGGVGGWVSQAKGREEGRVEGP